MAEEEIEGAAEGDFKGKFEGLGQSIRCVLFDIGFLILSNFEDMDLVLGEIKEPVV